MDRWTFKRPLGCLQALFYVAGVFAGISGFIFVPWSLFLFVHHNGSAISGYQQAGAYFVVSHGKSAEVTRDVFFKILRIERAAIVSVLTAAFIGISSLLAAKVYEWRTRSH